MYNKKLLFVPLRSPNTVLISTDFGEHGLIICDHGSIITGPNFGYQGKNWCGCIRECKKCSCM